MIFLGRDESELSELRSEVSEAWSSDNFGDDLRVPAKERG